MPVGRSRSRGIDQAPLAVHFKIASRPCGGSTDIAEEYGVFCGEVADAGGQVLWVDWSFAWLSDCTVVEFLADVLEMLYRVFKVSALVPGQERCKSLQRMLHVADKADVDPGDVGRSMHAVLRGVYFGAEGNASVVAGKRGAKQRHSLAQANSC